MSPVFHFLLFSARHRLGGAAHRMSDAAARGQRGQATAEYALVLLGVAAIALLLAAWAAKSGKITDLFDAVVDQLIDKVA